MASAGSYPIVLGPTLDPSARRKGDASTDSDLVSFKYNFKPPSIGPSAAGYLQSPTESTSQWLLEYNMAAAKEETQRASRSSTQGFQGSQSAAKEVDCVLIWNDKTQSYILDRLSCSFSLKYDRGHTRLSEKARVGLADDREARSDSQATSALGLDISGSDTLAPLDVGMDEAGDGDEGIDEDEEFVRQLELGLENAVDSEKEKESSGDDGRNAISDSQQHPRTGLGLLDNSILREDVITPRGSPYIDRPKGQFGGSKTSLGNTKNATSMQQATNLNTRSTPIVSPPSLTNSPRPAGLDSTLSTSGTWKPPPQRSNVAIAYDEEEDESDDDEEDEDDEEDDEGDDDDDLDDYARQLESSLQG